MTTQMQEIQEQRDAIALEFLGMNVSERLEQLLGVAKRTMSHLVGLVSRDAPAIAPLSAQQTEFLNKVANRNYVTLSQMPVRVPEGLNVPYLQYLHLLAGATEHASQIVDRLSKFTLFLGQLINEHNFQSSTVFNRSYYNGLKTQRALFNTSLSGCFAAGSSKVESTYGAVVQRNADWREVFKSLNLVADQINHVNRRTLDKKIEESAHYLDIIETKASRGELTDITPQIISELAEGTYEMAQDVEQYVGIWYKVQSLTEAVNATTGKLLMVYADQAA